MYLYRILSDDFGNRPSCSDEKKCIRQSLALSVARIQNNYPSVRIVLGHSPYIICPFKRIKF